LRLTISNRYIPSIARSSALTIVPLYFPTAYDERGVGIYILEVAYDA